MNFLKTEAVRGQFKESVDKAVRRVQGKLRRALMAAGRVILQESLQLVPKDTHALASSATIREEAAVSYFSETKGYVSDLLQSGLRQDRDTMIPGLATIVPSVVVGYGGAEITEKDGEEKVSFLGAGTKLFSSKSMFSEKTGKVRDKKYWHVARNPHDYAVYVHEDMEKRHVYPEQAKFLEIAAHGDEAMEMQQAAIEAAVRE